LNPDREELASPEFLRQLVEPWYRSLDDPASAQNSACKELVSGYARTAYGQRHSASSVAGLEDFRRSFPAASYSDFAPEIAEVKRGNYGSLLPERVARWVMTRGSTGSPKLFPATETHLSQILAVGARAVIHFVLRTDDQSMLDGEVLNLNFPSEVSSFQTENGEESYGYSSGTYARLNPSLGTLKLVPRQEEIDSLGGGISKSDWERRFELVYEKAKDSNVRCVMGVTPVILAFARHLSKRKGLRPRSLWKMGALFCTSVAKIQTRYAPALKAEYGEAPLVEMYTATEGVFAQQRDSLPYVSPNYDVYVFEAETRSGAKMLHELKPREWGRLIVSTPIFPRYDIGDYIEALGKGYFRVIGRARRLTAAEHVLYNLITFRRP
jgi:hypothetical protein